MASAPVRWQRPALFSLLTWAAVSLIHGLASYADQLRQGDGAARLATIVEYIPAYLPWPIFSAALYVFLARDPRRATNPRPAAVTLAALTIAFYLPEVAYQVIWDMHLRGEPLRNFVGAAWRWSPIYWLIDLGLFLSTAAVVAAIVLVRTAIDEHQQRQQLNAENLSLRLDIERHRIEALRAQLEPHFLFNALNAISSLVRGDDKVLALTALQQLSGLLRYALVATSREFVTVREELEFVRGYVALQVLRHGARLRFAVDGDTPEVLDATCLPLLIQPLVENAIRHDVECHGHDTEIRLHLVVSGDRLTVRVTNPLRADAPINPGSGLGLTAIRDRLHLRYGQRASCVSDASAGLFAVELTIPAAGAFGVRG